jgi:hypothetical protein
MRKWIKTVLFSVVIGVVITLVSYYIHAVKLSSEVCPYECDQWNAEYSDIARGAPFSFNRSFVHNGEPIPAHKGYCAESSDDIYSHKLDKCYPWSNLLTNFSLINFVADVGIWSLGSFVILIFIIPTIRKKQKAGKK